jgi:hypothetical protein
MNDADRERLDEIKARHLASTRGPWRWFGYVRGRGVMSSKAKKRRTDNLYLSTIDRGRTFIMNFRPLGLKDAEPNFQVREGRNGRMVGAGELVSDFKDYSGEMMSGIDHPDARAIEYSWEDRDFLLRMIAELQSQVVAH